MKSARSAVGARHASPLSRAMLIAALLLPAAAACGGPEDLTPEQVIEKAAPAMQAANSFHVTLETGNIQKTPPGLFLISADGDVVKPDKLQADVSATFGGLPIAVKVIVDGNSQYMTDPASGKWQAMPPALNMAQLFDPSKGVSDMLTNIQDLQSGGTEELGGVPNYILNGNVPASSLRGFSPEVTATADLTATLWIASSDFLLRRARLQGPFTEGEPAEIERTFTFRDYNKPVAIETPAVQP